jgi:DDE superfamily endonuclease
VLPSEQERPDIARFRARWKKSQGQLDPKRLVFIDETWAILRRLSAHQGHLMRFAQDHHGADPGLGFALAAACLARVPYGHRKTVTFLAALRRGRIDTPCVFDGPINGVSFMTYVEQFLDPTLRPGDIVILDNPSSYKGKAVRRAIRAGGARLLFLPPYSPDLNPIDPSAGSGGLRKAQTSHAQSRGTNL